MSPGLFASAPLRPVAALLDELVASTGPVEPTPVSLARAEGCVLADALIAPKAVPGRALALRSGWAVEAAATAGAGPYSPVFLSTRPQAVAPGAELPPGTDAVLPFEALGQTGASWQVLGSVAPGEGARRTGEDAQTGAELAAAGTRLSALHIALARSAGLEECRVRRPCVRLFGPPDDPLGAFLARRLEAHGATVERPGPGHPDELAAPSRAPDLVVACGWNERQALPEEGIVVIGRLASRPGEGTSCAVVEGRPLIIVGNGPGETLAAALLILQPWLERVTGARTRPPRAGRLTHKLASAVGLTEIALLRAVGDEWQPLAVADLTLTALARAESFLAIEPEIEGWPAGAIVEALEL